MIDPKLTNLSRPTGAIDGDGRDKEFTQATSGHNHNAEPSGHNAEHWVELCARAAVEQDPKKLLELVSEINRLLDVRNKRLAGEADHVS
ncbi:MAG: hypothetical protein WBX38_16875 [Candidatus Sulfotelmatobacter sp.]